MAHALGYLRTRLPCGRKIAAAAVGALWLFMAQGVAQPVPVYPPIRFTVFSAKPIADLTFAPRAGQPPLPVVFQPTARSARYEYRGAMPLRFVDATSGTVVAEANVPPNMHDALLLFTPIEPAAAGKGAVAGKLRYQVAVLDDGAARHGPGGLAILNLSGLALSGTVNGEKVSLKTGLNPTQNVGRSAKITLSTVFKNRTYQSYAGTATLRPAERALLILFPPFYAGSLEVQSRLLIDQPGGAVPASPVVAPKTPAKR